MRKMEGRSEERGNEMRRIVLAALVLAVCTAWASSAEAAGHLKGDRVDLALADSTGSPTSAATTGPMATRRRIIDFEIAAILGADRTRRRSLVEVAFALAPPIFLPGPGGLRRVRLQLVSE